MNKPLKRLIGELKLTHDLTQEQISERLGVGNTYLSSVINGTHPLTDSLIEKIFDVFGVRLKEVAENVKILNSGGNDSNVNNTDNNTPYIKLLPIYEIGGTLTEYDMVNDNKGELMLSPVKDADLAIIVPDNSMAPEYPSGARVWLKRIDDSAFIAWGKTYVLDTKNGPIIRIVNQSEREGYLLCTSVNPDQQRYSPFEIPYNKEVIFGIYRPLLVVTLK